MHRYRALAYFFIFAFFILEIYFPQRLRPFGARPEILLAVTFFFGFHFGMQCGLEAGIISGFLKDLFSVSGFGISIISFSAAGLLAGFLRKKFFKDNFISQFIIANVLVYFLSGVYYFSTGLRLWHSSLPGISELFWKTAVYKALVTGLIAPAVFFILNRFFEKAYRET